MSRGYIGVGFLFGISLYLTRDNVGLGIWNIFSYLAG